MRTVAGLLGALILAIGAVFATSDNSQATKAPTTCASGDWSIPIGADYVVTSQFGQRVDPITGTTVYHDGLDMAAPLGSPILAASAGTVSVAAPVDTGTGYGLYVMIDHGDGLITLYGHLSRVDVRVGDRVQAGNIIGLMGSTGRSTGSHLHFEARLNGVKSDSEQLLKDHRLSVDGKAASGLSACHANGDGGTIVTAALSQVGQPYAWGGGSLTGPSEGFGSGAGVVGFDCSGLTRYAVYQGTGVTLPRTVAEQLHAVSRIELNQVQAGDLLFIDGTSHIGIADGNGGLIHAPEPGQLVSHVSDYESNEYWRTAIWAAGRITK